MVQYKVQEANPETLTEAMIIRTNDDGSVSYIPIDPNNADYQAYLNKDNPDWNKPIGAN